jgi:DNA polymerase III sliding clamp (beta) subunit (PCNA family)
VETELLVIGHVAAASGLSISALRFYDGAGVLRPASVDPVTGYRRYRREQLAAARLVARLRRVGVPVADIGRILRERERACPAAAIAVLDAHLRRLEDGLADARSEISTVRTMLADLEDPMTETPTRPAPVQLRLPATALAEALGAVRFAAGSADGLQFLHAVLLDYQPAAATLSAVASDRYRLALRCVPGVSGSATPARALLPLAMVEELITLLRRPVEQARATLRWDGTRIEVTAGEQRLEHALLDDDFPDYRSLLPARGAQSVTVRPGELAAALGAADTRTMVRRPEGVQYQVNVLSVDGTGTLSVTDPGPDADRVGVSRQFLLDALDAADGDQLLLELNGPLAPLAIRNAGGDGGFSILMPTRLDEDAAGASSTPAAS